MNLAAGSARSPLSRAAITAAVIPLVVRLKLREDREFVREAFWPITTSWHVHNLASIVTFRQTKEIPSNGKRSVPVKTPLFGHQRVSA